jgi:hypothetical protein
MLRRVTALYGLVALTSIGTALAQAPEPVTDTITLQQTDRITVSGTLQSLGSDRMVVRIDQHGHSIPFQIASTSQVQSGLKPGSRVTVVYHPLGATGQMADTVTADSGSGRTEQIAGSSSSPQPIDTGRAKESEPAQSAPQSAPREATPSPAPARELPATASTLPVVGAAGLLALLASLTLRAYERRQS